jgi:hypothetical protein
MTGWRLVLAVLAVLAPACPAAAADAPPVAEGAATPPPAAEKCPDVYGVWETMYAVGKFGIEDATPWFGGLLLKATIGREKTTLVWLKSDDFPNAYTSSVFRPITSFEQRDNRFAGKNAGGADMLAEIIDESDLLELYPDHRCMLYVGTAYPRQGGGMNFGQRVIMTQAK